MSNENINADFDTNNPNPTEEQTMTDIVPIDTTIEAQGIPEAQQQSEDTILVALSYILLDDTFRCREQDDEETNERYAERWTCFKVAVESGEKPEYPFPAVWVWQDADGQYYLVAGFHRYQAACRSGLDKILVQVFKGTKNDAIWFAIQDNRNHPLRLNHGDVKYCIEKALRLSLGKTPFMF